MNNKDPKNGPYDDFSESSDESSGGNRWDDADLDGLEYKHVFVDDGDAEEKLPEFFDTNLVQKNRQKRDECQLCGNTFNKLAKKRYFCNYCGRSICDACSQNYRRLSQMDKKNHKVCDFCDHQLSNF